MQDSFTLNFLHDVEKLTLNLLFKMLYVLCIRVNIGNYIKIQELRKSMAANNTMGKSFFLFYVDLPQVARMIVEQSYKAIANAYKRKNHESELNQRLMDKYERIEAISANLKNSEEFESSESLQLQLQEVQDMVSLKKREKF